MPSTVVAKMEYDAASETLRVVFTSGLVYDYKNVPQSVFNEMKASGAKGIYLNHHIKGKHDFEKVE